jgi:hypothetical protein
MKNNFVATFILLAAGLVFNDVASVEAKPTKRQLQQQIQQIGMEATDAVYRCHGTFSNYKEPQQCIKARQVKDAVYSFCFRANRVPMACDIFSSISQAEMNAIRNEGPDNAMRAIGASDNMKSLGDSVQDYGMKALGD